MANSDVIQSNMIWGVLEHVQKKKTNGTIGILGSFCIRKRYLFFKIKHLKIWNFWHDLDLTLKLGSPKWTQIARRPSPLYSTCKIAHKTCATPLIFVFYVWWPFVTWSWPWTELNIKHLLNQCLALYFRSTRSKFWPKADNFEVSTARNLKAPILTFDLTLT